MTRIIRAEEVVKAPEAVELALFGNITPEAHQAGKRDRLALQLKLARKAQEMANDARHDRLEQIKLATEESTKLSARARADADAIVAKANAEKKRIEEEARQRGLEAARSEAHEEAVRNAAEAMVALDAIARDLKALRERFLRGGADGMIGIIRAVLESVLRGEVRIDEGLVKRTLLEAIREVTAADRIIIRVHPDDFGAASELRSDILRQVIGLSEIVFTPDEGITRGGALIETSFGRVDARIESQVAEKLRTLAVSLGNLTMESLEESAAESGADADLPPPDPV